MKLYDISMTIEPGMTVYKDRENKQPKFVTVASQPAQSVHETELTMNMHTGTHVDYPRHVMPDGTDSNTATLGPFLGTAVVLDLTRSVESITRADLEGQAIEYGDLVLLKTTSSLRESFDFKFVYLDDEAAEYLVALGVRGVGIDALGIERDQPGHPTHHALLGNGIFIIEGLRLKDVPAKRYRFVGLPLKIAGVEAAPLRAILIEE
ncbi:MAG: cyclase family protein [Bacillota bacterium]|nr:cyclase family protein [Bacillota bacterium]